MRKRIVTIEIVPLIKLDNNNLFEDKDILNDKITNLNINYERSNLWIFDVNYISNLYNDDQFINKRIYLTNILNFIVNKLEYLNTNGYGRGSEFILTQKELVNTFTRKSYKKYIEILISNGILSPIKYIPGEYYYSKKLGQPRKFKFNEKFLKANDLALLLIQRNENKGIRMDIDPELEATLNEHDPRIVSSMKELKIDLEGSMAAEIENYYKGNNSVESLISRLNIIFKFMNSRYIKKGIVSNRHYTSITGLSRISREFLIPRMHEIDLANSQPSIIANMFIQNGLNFDTNFITDTEDGILYQRFYKLYDKKVKDIEEIRKKTKQSFYKNILFGFNERSIINKQFKEIYPKTWDYIKSIGKDNIKKIFSRDENDRIFISNQDEIKNNKNLAGILQQSEAAIFLNLRPTKSKIYATIHDSIIVSDITDIPELQETIKSKFKIKVQLNLK